MIQHRGSIKNFYYIYSTENSKNKWLVDKHRLVLSLKVMFFYFSKQTKNDSKCASKIKTNITKSTLLLLNMLLIDFIIFIKQSFFKKNYLLCKITIKKVRVFLKNTNVFIKSSVYIFLPKHRLKEQ